MTAVRYNIRTCRKSSRSAASSSAPSSRPSSPPPTSISASRSGSRSRRRFPAAVISMAILSAGARTRRSSRTTSSRPSRRRPARCRRSSSCCPGLVIVGWWTGFPFWQSFLICVSGGVLGVLFTIPLRRALVTNSDLPYPEGVAAAEVLKVGSGARGETQGRRRRGARGADRRSSSGRSRRPGWRSSTATRVAAAEVTGFFRLGGRRRRAATTSPARSRCSARATWSGCRSAWRC